MGSFVVGNGTVQPSVSNVGGYLDELRALREILEAAQAEQAHLEETAEEVRVSFMECAIVTGPSGILTLPEYADGKGECKVEISSTSFEADNFTAKMIYKVRPMA